MYALFRNGAFVSGVCMQMQKKMHLLLHGQCMCAGYFVVVCRCTERVLWPVACASIQHFQQFPTISWRTKSESWTLMRWKWWQRLTAGGQLKLKMVDSWKLDIELLIALQWTAEMWWRAEKLDIDLLLTLTPWSEKLVKSWKLYIELLIMLLCWLLFVWKIC